MIRHDGIGQIDLTLIAGCGFGSPAGWPKQTHHRRHHGCCSSRYV
jgi:hypothetical protein